MMSSGRTITVINIACTAPSYAFFVEYESEKDRDFSRFKISRDQQVDPFVSWICAN